MDRSFSDFAGDDGVMDIDEFSRLADAFAVENVDRKCKTKMWFENESKRHVVGRMENNTIEYSLYQTTWHTGDIALAVAFNMYGYRFPSKRVKFKTESAIFRILFEMIDSEIIQAQNNFIHRARSEHK